MEDSIFTKIINGEIPSHKVYEDDKTLAFLDINPTVEGHVLVIPKTQVEFVWDLAADDYQALMQTVQKVAKQLRRVLAKPFVGEMVVGVDVPHAHVHLMAFNSPSEMAPALGGPGAAAEQEYLADLAEKLRF